VHLIRFICHANVWTATGIPTHRRTTRGLKPLVNRKPCRSVRCRTCGEPGISRTGRFGMIVVPEESGPSGPFAPDTDELHTIGHAFLNPSKLSLSSPDLECEEHLRQFCDRLAALYVSIVPLRSISASLLTEMELLPFFGIPRAKLNPRRQSVTLSRHLRCATAVRYPGRLDETQALRNRPRSRHEFPRLSAALVEELCEVPQSIRRDSFP